MQVLPKQPPLIVAEELRMPVPPAGMRFLPFDEELVGYCLLRKLTGMSLPYGVVVDCYLYGKENLWEIWQAHDANRVETAEVEDLYFFTRLKRKSPEAKHVERRVGLGSWTGEDKGKEITAMVLGIHRCIGWKKRLRFEKSGTHHDGDWIMHGYSINESALPSNSTVNDYVLCRTRKNEKSMSRKRKTTPCD